MDAETRGAIEGLGQEMRAGFARVDRYFELVQAQYQQVNGRFTGVEDRLDRIESRVGGIESELRSFRNWVAVQFAELRTSIHDLIKRVGALEAR